MHRCSEQVMLPMMNERQVHTENPPTMQRPIHSCLMLCFNCRVRLLGTDPPTKAGTQPILVEVSGQVVAAPSSPLASPVSLL